MTYGPDEFRAEFNVSHETMTRLAAYDSVLLDWSSRHNLIARSTIPERWERHYRDSAQLHRLAPETVKDLVDLGSGAGFPGLVLAALGMERGLQTTLVESVGKKAAFLRAAIAAMGLNHTEVVPQRIENISIPAPDLVTARALAQLEKLIGYAYEFASEKTLLLFPKGQDVEAELTAASKYWHMDVEKHPSITHAGSTILLLRNVKPKRPVKPSKKRRRRDK